MMPASAPGRSASADETRRPAQVCWVPMESARAHGNRPRATSSRARRKPWPTLRHRGELVVRNRLPLRWLPGRLSLVAIVDPCAPSDCPGVERALWRLHHENAVRAAYAPHILGKPRSPDDAGAGRWLCVFARGADCGARLTRAKGRRMARLAPDARAGVAGGRRERSWWREPSPASLA